MGSPFGCGSFRRSFTPAAVRGAAGPAWLADSHSMSLGKMVTDLLRRALETHCPTKTVNGLIVLDPGPRSAPVSSATVRRLVEGGA
jgi:hypothetical protein